MNRRRVVVTGMGIVSPNGVSIESFWTNLTSLRVPIRPLSRFTPWGLRTTIAAEIRDLQLAEYHTLRNQRRYGRHAIYAAIAAGEAIKHSGLDLPLERMDRFGTIVGTAHGAVGTMEHQMSALTKEGATPSDVLTPYVMPHASQNTPVAFLSIYYGLQGPNHCVFSACAAGGHAIGEATEKIQLGKADLMLAGGAEASIVEYCFHGYCKIKAMSINNEDPESALRPFDRNRDGFVMGEGSAMLLLEDEEHARKRGARIFGEIAGYGCSNDATHLTNISTDGQGITKSMSLALEDAGLSPDQVDYISAHGSGTQINDRSETRAIRSVFGDHADRLFVNSTKPLTGHMMGAAGAAEVLITLLQMRHGAVLPTLNLTEPDKSCDLDYVPEGVREKEVRVALSNAVGLGGANATIAVRAYEQ